MKKYKIIKNNKHIYAVKRIGSRGYYNSKVRRLKYGNNRH